MVLDILMAVMFVLVIAGMGTVLIMGVYLVYRCFFGAWAPKNWSRRDGD